MTSESIAIIGAGNVGTVIARLARHAGLPVTMANSRGPASLAEKALSLDVAVAALDEAAASADVVVLAIPFFRTVDLDPKMFDGKLVIDPTNFDPARDGAVADLVRKALPAEVLRDHLPGARVIKAFSSVHAHNIQTLARPSGSPTRSAVPIAGHPEEAKLQVSALLDRLGWDTVDAGGLVDTRLFDLGTPAFVLPYLTDSSWASMAADDGQPVSSDALRKLLDLAR